MIFCESPSKTHFDKKATSLPDQPAKTSCAKSISKWKRSSIFPHVSSMGTNCFIRLTCFRLRWKSPHDRIGDLHQTTLYFDFLNSREFVIKARVLSYITADDDQRIIASRDRNDRELQSAVITWCGFSATTTASKCWRFTSAWNSPCLFYRKIIIFCRPTADVQWKLVSPNEWIISKPARKAKKIEKQ